MEKIIIETPSSWTDDELYEFCVANRNLVIERNAKGQLILNEPAGGYSSHQNIEIGAELVIWNRKSKLGIAFDSSGGFRLPNGAMRSPDAAWISKDRWEALSEKDKTVFPPLCPDFLIELRSASDSLSELKEKMQEWMTNGCRLAWLIDPISQKTWIYRSDDSVEEVVGMDVVLSGEEVLPGFELDLRVL